MDTQGSTAVTFALLFLLCFQHPMAHPIDSLSPAKELASMEALLQRLEEKVSLMEALQNSPNLEDPESQREGLAEFLDDGNSQQVETPADSAPFLSDRSSLLKRMRGIQTAKSCFGRRLDRIGEVTAMGCRGSRRN
ncbi:natriuretic peptides A-like [Podarcis lilfordi]|uniref:Natriuretic peptides A-like n=1 Tax=Podarcis lilfordi TaxID=74358 RepID=A0AA35KSW2_9SAUR|nr:natriuretic peptides A-like [Podarcis lilfordi]